MGRFENSPPQLGQRPCSNVVTHSSQNVHSNEQISAMAESGDRSQSQHSQLGLSSSICIFRHGGKN